MVLTCQKTTFRFPGTGEIPKTRQPGLVIGAAWFDYRRHFSSVNTVAANPPSRADPSRSFQVSHHGKNGHYLNRFESRVCSILDNLARLGGGPHSDNPGTFYRVESAAHTLNP